MSASVNDPSTQKLELIEQVFAAQNHPDYTNISLACPQDSELFPAAKLGRITASLIRRDNDIIGRYALPPVVSAYGRLRAVACTPA